MKYLAYPIYSIYYLLLIVAVTTTQAQTSDEPEEVDYTFHVLYIDTDPVVDRDSTIEAGVDLKFEEDGEVFQIGARNRRITRAFKYTGNRQLVFFEEIPDGQGGLIRKALVATDLGSPGFKIIVLAKRKQEGSYVSFRLDTDQASFKDNSIRMVNFSNQVLKGKVVDMVKTIQPRSLQDFKLPSERRPMVTLAIAGDDGEDAYLIDKRRVGMRKNERKMILLYQSTRNPKRVEYSTFIVPDEDLLAENRSDADLDDIDISVYLELGED